MNLNFIMDKGLRMKLLWKIVAAVQAGLLNGKFISRLQTNQINAIGLTGIDNGLFTADYFNDNLGFVGLPVLTEIRTGFIQL